MPIPEFTPDEKYLINFLKTTQSTGSANPYMCGHVAGGTVLGAFGGYYNSVPMMTAAFAVLCGFRIYEKRY